MRNRDFFGLVREPLMAGAVVAVLLLTVGCYWSSQRSADSAIYWAGGHQFHIRVSMGNHVEEFTSVGIPKSYHNSNGWYFKDAKDGKAKLVDNGFVAEEQ